MKASADTLINLTILFAFFIGLSVWWLVKHGSSRSRIADRARESVSDHASMIISLSGRAGDELSGRWSGLLRQLSVFGDRMPLFDAAYRAKLQATMLQAGYQSRQAVSVLLAIKFSFGVAVAITTIMLGSDLPFVGAYPLARMVAMLGAFIIGMIVPEYFIAWQRARRRKAIAAYLPDALDLLVICTNAGNSFAVSLRRVAQELKTICPPLAAELLLTADELKLSGDTNQALNGLGVRVDLPSIKALIGTLVQSMRYGTPITQALKTLSRSERLTLILSLEERAAKLAPKMVVPMMIFILPAVVVISAGPAVIQLLAFINK